MTDSIVLASASPRRKELLEQVGIHFEIIPSQCEEVIVGSVPEMVVRELARQKAQDVALKMQFPGRIVLGADTVVAFENRILGKPNNKEEAYEMIRMLSGNEHHVYTGVCFSYLDKRGEVVSSSFYEKTSVYVTEMTEKEIEAYIEGKMGKCLGYEWADKAGAYGIQGSFAAFIKRIDGDYNNVVGLPVARVYQELKKLKVT